MRITPRNDEVAQVVEMLESMEGDSAQAVAKALIKAVAEMLQMRDWVALTHVWGDGSLGVNWGPYGNEAEATAAAAKIAVGADKFRLVKLHSPGVALANYDGKKGGKGYCQHPDCGHATWMHLFEASSRGACALEVCPCKKFTS